jgi:ACT domain-containing protein
LEFLRNTPSVFLQFFVLKSAKLADYVSETLKVSLTCACQKAKAEIAVGEDLGGATYYKFNKLIFKLLKIKYL